VGDPATEQPRPVLGVRDVRSEKGAGEGEQRPDSQGNTHAVPPRFAPSRNERARRRDAVMALRRGRGKRSPAILISTARCSGWRNQRLWIYAIYPVLQPRYRA